MTTATLPPVVPVPRPLPPAGSVAGWRPPSGAGSRAVPVATRAPDRGWRGQYSRFLLVGAVTTVVGLLLYAVLQSTVGPQAANALALVLTTDANTAANRRLAFHLHRPSGPWRQHAQGWAALGVSLVLTSGTLAAAEAAGVTGGWAQAGLLAAANVAGGVAHFALLRCWVFRR